MNSKILNSILIGVLKPWLISFDDKGLKAIVKQVQNKPNNTIAELQSNLSVLLQPFPKLLKDVEYPITEPLQTLRYTVNQPAPISLLNHYYKALIDAETVRYFNVTIHNPLIQNNELDVPFQIEHQSLNSIAVLCNQTNNEILERGFEEKQTAVTETTFFALTYLRNSLIAVYFSIQEPFKEYLPTVYNSFAEYALYCLDNECSDIDLKQSTPIEVLTTIPKKNIKPDALTFGFKGDLDKLKKVVAILNLRMDFLNETKTTADEFIEVFTAKNLKSLKTQIHIDCATNEFEEIAQQFKIFASKFTPTTINKSGLFYTKDGTLIDANLLYVTKHKSKLADEKKALIKAIFQDINK